MSVVILMGRILFALVFLGTGLGHLTQTDSVATYVEVRGVRRAAVVVRVTGVTIVVGALAVAVGVWTDLAALGLTLYALAVAFAIHHFWTDEGEMQTMEQANFMKSAALAGGGLLLFAIVAISGDTLGLTVTGPVFDLSL